MNNFKIVPKMERNLAAFYIVLPNGESRQIGLIEFPNDKQVVDNVEAINAVANIMKRRIKKSI